MPKPSLPENQIAALISELDLDAEYNDEHSAAITSIMSPRETLLPSTYPQARRSPHWPEWKEAMDNQLRKLHDAGTWETAILPSGCKAIPCKWVYSVKDGKKAVEAMEQKKSLCTARLVARGDMQQKGFDYDETFAPVVKLVSLRVMLTLASILDVDLAHWDVVAAFLNGDLKETVYMKQPPAYNDGTNSVLLLRKSIYGLHQSARRFY